jgi:enoyl-CoA hydratase/carnithine racemase
MNFETLNLRENGAVLEISIKNPPVNLMSGQMVGELFQLTGYLMQNQHIRVVVIDSANEDFFIAHFDLDDLVASANDPSKASRYPDMNILQSLGLAWQNLPQVKIAKVDGRCRGGGLEFILALDMRFASKRSLFCFPESSAGFLASGGGATRAILAAGPARGLEILLSARDFSAEEAERYGLINRAVDDAELDAYVADLVARIAARSAAVVAMHRAVIGQAVSPVIEPMFAAMAAENVGMLAGLASAEMQEMMQLHLAAGQTADVELDLPATMAGFVAKRAGE